MHYHVLEIEELLENILFILRGVRFIGIDSIQCPMEKRVAVWEKLAMEWKGTNLESGITEVPLVEISQKVDDMLAGKL